MDFKAQHALTAARELAQNAWLHQEMHRCISEDPLDRRGRWARAFFCADRFSRQFLTAMPLRDTDSVFCNAEWDEAIACYMGLVSPACKGHAARGVVLDVTGAPGLDPYGEVLFTHMGVVNKAGARTEWHNGLKNAIFQTTRLAGIPVEDETLIRVLGDGIVDDAKRQQVVDAIVSAPTRADVEARKHKLGVIPDLLLGPEKRLVDIKTVCAKKYYRSGLIRGAAGSGEGRRKRKREDSPRQTPLTKTYGSPVDERALTVHREYFAKAVECDREYNIFDEDAMTGPMCRAIGGRGDVIGMAFGAVGEASSSVLDHAKACAEAISKEAMSEGDVDAVTKDTGYGRVLGEIIRDWGVACSKRKVSRAGAASQNPDKHFQWD